MRVENELVAKIHGAFSLTAADGSNLTPKGLKERGLLALMVLQPEQRRSRASLQDMLWSESPPKKGGANLRRVLSNLRVALGNHAWRLKADRKAVWFEPQVLISTQKVPGSVALEDLDIPGSEFERWVTDIRAQLDEPVERPFIHLPTQTPQETKAPEVRIEAALPNETSEERFITDQIASSLAERLQTLGDVTVHIDHQVTPADIEDTSDTLVTIRTLDSKGEWLVHVRIQALPSMRFLASRHARLPNSSAAVWDHPAMKTLLNTCVRDVVDNNAMKAHSQPAYAIQNAVRRIYSGDRRLVSTAETLLRNAQSQDVSGLALAWRGFLRLTEILEFRNGSEETRDAALQMAEEATLISPENPVVWALAAQVNIKLSDDLDLGTYCARRSLDCLSDDPYALDAMSLALETIGATEDAHRIAEQALRSASGLANEFSWDMQCCLTALGLGEVDDAIVHARSAHLKVPGYRPAVRYLAALNLSRERVEEASKYVARLKVLEPDFSVDLIANENYPLHTFRRLGLGGDLKLELVR